MNQSLSDKIREQFAAMTIYKDPTSTSSLFAGRNLPSFVKDFLLKRYINPDAVSYTHLITLIDYILLCKDNKFKWGNKQFQEKYLCNYNMGENLIPTSLWKPFFYLSSEPFYSLVWRESPPNKLLKSLSARLLKEYLDYAKLDDELWELLKDESNRLYLRDSIIKNYFD